MEPWYSQVMRINYLKLCYNINLDIELEQQSKKIYVSFEKLLCISKWWVGTHTQTLGTGQQKRGEVGGYQVQWELGIQIKTI